MKAIKGEDGEVGVSPDHRCSFDRHCFHRSKDDVMESFVYKR